MCDAGAPITLDFLHCHFLSFFLKNIQELFSCQLSLAFIGNLSLAVSLFAQYVERVLNLLFADSVHWPVVDEQPIGRIKSASQQVSKPESQSIPRQMQKLEFNMIFFYPPLQEQGTSRCGQRAQPSAFAAMAGQGDKQLCLLQEHLQVQLKHLLA